MLKKQIFMFLELGQLGVCGLQVLRVLGSAQRGLLERISITKKAAGLGKL